MTFKPWIAIAVGVILLAAIAWAGITQLQLDAARAKLANLTTQMAAEVAANDSNQETIKVQAASLESWAGEAAKGVARADEATARLKVANQARAATAAKLSAIEAKDKALPKCVALLNVDIAAACPAHAQALKERTP